MKKMQQVSKVITEVYHRGRFINGRQEKERGTFYVGTSYQSLYEGYTWGHTSYDWSPREVWQ